jgi:site-specific recombinase XerD
MKYLKKFFNWCISQGHLKGNPIIGIKKPKLPKHLPRGLAKEDASKILYSSFNYPWRYSFERWRNHAILATLLYTGIRAQELRMLRVTEVNLGSGNIFINSGKGRKDRYVPIHPDLKRILGNYIVEVKRLNKDAEFFFTGVRSNIALTPKDLAAICKKISKHICIKFTCHTLRHTCATELLNQNINLYKVSQILGHSDVRTTTIYLNVATSNIQKDIDAIEMYRN